MAERLYVTHENHLGEKRYQPRTDVGRRAWREYDIFGSWVEWLYGERGHPILYRSRRRAERMARREMRRFARGERNTFKAVSDD